MARIQFTNQPPEVFNPHFMHVVKLQGHFYMHEDTLTQVRSQATSLGDNFEDFIKRHNLRIVTTKLPDHYKIFKPKYLAK